MQFVHQFFFTVTAAAAAVNGPSPKAGQRHKHDFSNTAYTNETVTLTIFAAGPVNDTHCPTLNLTGCD